MSESNHERSAPVTVTFLNPPGLYDASANGYSHVAVVQAPARFVFIAGQSGEDEQGQLSPDFQAQVDRAMHNLNVALAAAGASLADVVKLTVLIVDHSLERLQIFGAARHAAWGNGTAPACTVIPVPKLALDTMLFEIEAIAATRA